MDRSDGRPPRSSQPRSTASAAASPPRYDSRERERPLLSPTANAHRANVSFQVNERGDRQAPLDDARGRNLSAYRDAALPPTPNDNNADAEAGLDPALVARKKSLVRPDREKIEPGHRQWHYRNHAARLEDEGRATVGLMPSSSSSFFHTQAQFLSQL